MKRTLSLLLALVLVLGSFSTVFAAMPETDVEKAELLKELGVLLGNNSGDLMLDDDLLRRDAVVLLSRLMKAEETARNFPTDDMPFDDNYDPLYDGYIAWAHANGYAVGISATKFDPKGDLTAQQFATFLLRALGYEIDAEAYETAFETAEELGIFADLNVEKETVLKRKDMAVMTFNALYVPMKDSEVTLGEYLELELPQEEPEFAIEEVKATKVNELTVTFANAVDTEEVKLAVKKGNATVSVEKTVWNADKTVVKLETTAKMTKGTYVVEATLDEKTVSGSVEVENQFINQIVILNDVALTGKGALSDGKEADAAHAYVYYDVLDQYGESLRSIANITWSTSVGDPYKKDNNVGRLTLRRTDGKAFTYGEQIYVSGVDQKTGVNVTKTLTVGQAQALNSIEVAGFLKKGTTEIIKELPSGFKDKAYMLLYKLKDQNGNEFTIDDTDGKLDDQVTFVSSDPLVISKVYVEADNNTVVLDGEEYFTAFLEPGMNVDRGGEVTILVIAKKTGNKSEINTAVGQYQILTEFDLIGTKDMIADGESVEIEFRALDQHGVEIKNFRTLARQEALNSIRFNASEGTLRLFENNDGTASLIFIDRVMPWTNSQTTDGIDRNVSLTSILVGGNSSNLMINIQDKARPDAIKSVDMENILVHLGSTELALSDFDFLDQYGRDMSDTSKYQWRYSKYKDSHWWNKNGGYVFDNGFFGASESGALKNNDFSGFKFAVRASYKGENQYYDGLDKDTDKFIRAKDGVYIDTEGAVVVDKFSTPPTPEPLSYKAKLVDEAHEGEIKIAQKSGMSLKFDIVKSKDTFKTVESVSTARTEPLTIININQVKSLAIRDIGKIYMPTENTMYSTGETIQKTTGGGILTQLDWNTEKAVAYSGDKKDVGFTDAHIRKIRVTGNYNGKSVVIPGEYVAKGTENKLSLTNDLEITGIKDLRWRDLYDITSARYVRKDAEDTVEVVVYEVKNYNEKGSKLTTLSKKVTISDAMPMITTINGPESRVIKPTNTNIGKSLIDAWFSNRDIYDYKDQYGVDIEVDLTYKGTDINENADGYADNNFAFVSNDSKDLTIKGAERGDTFVITIVAKDKVSNETKTFEVKITVGSDNSANITNDLNNYLKSLIGTKDGTGLERQRLDSLGVQVD